MKKLILEHLRSFTEGRLARHTTSNPSFDGNVFFYTPSEMRAEISIANQIYRENSDELGSVGEGDGLYEFILFPSGKGKFGFGGKMSSIGSKKAPGDYKDSQGGSARYLYVKANRGILHPEYDLDSDSGKRHSPMTQAKTKVLFYLGKEIMDFIEGSVGYDDGRGTELQKQKMDMDKWGYKLDREKKEKEMASNKGELTMDKEKADLINKIQDVVSAKLKAIKNRDTDKIKVYKDLEQQLRDELKKL